MKRQAAVKRWCIHHHTTRTSARRCCAASSSSCAAIAYYEQCWKTTPYSKIWTVLHGTVFIRCQLYGVLYGSLIYYSLVRL